MPISEEDIRQIVKRRISVTHQDVAVAKGLLVKHFNQNTRAMIESALADLGLRQPDRLIIKGEEDATTEVERLGDYFSHALCTVEALWDLLNAGIFLPASHSLENLRTSVQITYMRGNSASSGGEDFRNVFQIPPFPLNVIRSLRETTGFILTDPDLYLQSVHPSAMPADIAEALSESIRCFRAELYLACAVMLGKASEGIWIELGKTLVDALPKVEQAKQAQFRTSLDNHVTPSFATKLRKIMDFFRSNQTQFTVVSGSAGVNLDQVQLAYQWAEMVRDSRNVIHYGTQPNIPNNYTNVATLLLAGSTHLKNMLSLHAAAVANPGI